VRRFTLITLLALLVLVAAAGFLSYWVGTHRHLRPIPSATPSAASPTSSGSQ